MAEKQMSKSIWHKPFFFSENSEHDRVHFLQEVRLLVLQFPLPPSRSRPQYAIHFLVVAERRGVGSSCPARVLLRVFRVSVGVRLSMSTSHFFSMPLSHLVFLPPRPSPPPGYGFTTVCLALPHPYFQVLFLLQVHPDMGDGRGAQGGEAAKG